MPVRDIQNDTPKDAIPIDEVGIKSLRYPIRVLDRTRGYQYTVATVSMFVNLPKHYRGTHMSRFVEILNEFHGKMSFEEVHPMLEKMQKEFDAQSAGARMEFPYFVRRVSPIAKSESIAVYDAFFDASLEEDFDFRFGVTVPVNLLCPCSKEISDEGAHNQRAYIKLEVKTEGFVWLEELIQIAEDAASAPVYPLLKRVDEKFITEKAYNTPRFVEDAARRAAKLLSGDKRITSFLVEVESMESIHNHNAYALIKSHR